MMTPSFIFFLLMISLLSLLALVLLWILDFANSSSKQKLIFLKIYFALMIIAPFCYIFMRLHFSDSLIVTMSGEFINQKILPSSSDVLINGQLAWSFYTIVIYLVGLTFMLSRILISYISANNQLCLSTPIIIQGQLAFKCEHIKNPLCFGLIKPKIYIPADAESRWTEREIQISIAHEKHHLEQYDPFWKLLSHLVQAFLFFAPWMYYLNRKFELEMEIFCDTKVCMTTGASICEYGNVLLAMTCAQSQNFTFNNITDSTLKRRFLAMKMKTKNAVVLTSVLSILLLLAGSSAIVMASGFIDKKSYFRISSKIIIDGKVISSPVILAKENQTALIVITNTNSNGAQGLRMKLVAQNAEKFGSNKAIEINFHIEYKNGNNEILANPRMIVAPNHEEKIKLSSDSEHSYEMHVLAENVGSLNSE